MIKIDEHKIQIVSKKKNDPLINKLSENDFFSSEKLSKMSVFFLFINFSPLFNRIYHFFFVKCIINLIILITKKKERER